MSNIVSILYQKLSWSIKDEECKKPTKIHNVKNDQLVVRTDKWIFFGSAGNSVISRTSLAHNHYIYVGNKSLILEICFGKYLFVYVRLYVKQCSCCKLINVLYPKIFYLLKTQHSHHYAFAFTNTTNHVDMFVLLQKI